MTAPSSGSKALVIADSTAVVPHVDPRELSVEERLQQAEEHDKKLRHIVEDIPIKIKNQSGSSAGAGSGEFYIYRNARDAERKRLEVMEKEWREEQAKLLAKRQWEDLEATLEGKTEKRRAKRQKQKDKKQAKKAAKTAATPGSADGDQVIDDKAAPDARAEAAQQRDEEAAPVQVDLD